MELFLYPKETKKTHIVCPLNHYYICEECGVPSQEICNVTYLGLVHTDAL